MLMMSGTIYNCSTKIIYDLIYNISSVTLEPQYPHYCKTHFVKSA